MAGHSAELRAAVSVYWRVCGQAGTKAGRWDSVSVARTAAKWAIGWAGMLGNGLVGEMVVLLVSATVEKWVYCTVVWLAAGTACALVAMWAVWKVRVRAVKLGKE